MSGRTPPFVRRAPLVTALAAIALTAGTWLLPPDAEAAVQPGRGFDGTVLGWTSWYGTYELSGIGTVWCIDHGMGAPDADLGYQRTDPGVDARTATAMAWVAGRFGGAPDRIDAAAVMLVLHDLHGAVYPFGRLDLAHLGPADVAGFEGHGAEVLARARAIKADAFAHAALQSPVELQVEMVGPGAPASGEASDPQPESAPGAIARLVDSLGQPVSGVTIRFALRDATTTEPLLRSTGPDGTATVSLATAGAAAAATAEAIVPDLRAAVYGPATPVAQRVILPAVTRLSAGGQLPIPPPPEPSPSTTAPTTTSTSAPTTTAAAAAPTTAAMPAPVVPASARLPFVERRATLPAPASTVGLAATGAAVRRSAMTGCALVFAGACLVLWQRRT